MHKYLVIVAVTFLVAIGGGFITEAGLGWYSNLNLPASIPNGNTYSIAWTIIYILTAISAILIWTLKLRGNLKKRRKLLTYTFIANAALNLLWSYIFFGMHSIGLALFEAMFLKISIILLIILAWPIHRIAVILLIPYLCWVTFASYLTYSVLILN